MFSCLRCVCPHAVLGGFAFDFSPVTYLGAGTIWLATDHFVADVVAVRLDRPGYQVGYIVLLRFVIPEGSTMSSLAFHLLPVVANTSSAYLRFAGCAYQVLSGRSPSHGSAGQRTKHHCCEYGHLLSVVHGHRITNLVIESVGFVDIQVKCYTTCVVSCFADGRMGAELKSKRAPLHEMTCRRVCSSPTVHLSAVPEKELDQT
jgi:hypothetical protein